MRSVISISLPKKLKKEVMAAVKAGRYATTSEFFRDLLRRWRADKSQSQSKKL